jgi:hypothetical protein
VASGQRQITNEGMARQSLDSKLSQGSKEEKADKDLTE